MVVEHKGGKELARARWLFPAYLLVFAAFVLPLAAAGERFVGATPRGTNTCWRCHRHHSGAPGSRCWPFLGGFSAATGMGHRILRGTGGPCSATRSSLPGLLRGKGYQRAEQDLGALLLRVRRLAIVGLLFAAWLIDRLMLTQLPLAMIGLLSFSAIAHLAPPVIAGIVWPRSNRRGAIVGAHRWHRGRGR